MAVADGAGLPLAIGIVSASPHEITLVEATPEGGAAVRVAPELPPPGDALRVPCRELPGLVQLGCIVTLLRHL